MTARPVATSRTSEGFARAIRGMVIFACALLAVHSEPVNGFGGRTYVVAPDGDDTGPGSPDRPFRSIQHAANVVEPGDTVVVEDGTYVGTGDGTSCASPTARPVVCVARGGSPGRWVTFRARNKWRARIDGRSNASTSGFTFAADVGHVRIEGFDVSGMGNAGQSASGFELYSGGSDAIIAGNNIHDVGRLCTDTTNGQTGIFVAQPRVVVTRNVIHDIGRFSAGEQGCVPSTIHYRNHDHGIYVNGRKPPGGSGVLITNNIFYGHRRGWPIQIYPGTVENVAILNNTFLDENPYNPGHILIGASTTNGRIVNNLFDDPRVAALNFHSGTHANLVVANNLSSGAIARTRPGAVAFSGNLEYVDPRIVRGDMRVEAGSPAIDHGRRLPEVSEDIDGVRRPKDGAWDIGATEGAGRGPAGTRAR